MSIKKQLAKFYDKQGLTGKHRRKAMQWDMKAAKANAVAFRGYAYRMHSLDASFIFTGTPEGGEYWVRRAYLC